MVGARLFAFVLLSLSVLFTSVACDDPGKAEAVADVLLPDKDAGGDVVDGDKDADDGDSGVQPDLPEGPVPNEGWIGGPCTSETECDFDEAVCLTGDDGFEFGSCSQACDRFCPDRDGNNSITFCVDVDGAGMCLSRCDETLYPGSGCRDGYACRVVPRFLEPGTLKGTCVPSDWETPVATTDCLEALERRGIPWNNWDYEPRIAEGTNLTCDIDDPIVVGSLINGVSYRYFDSQHPDSMAMSCELALALDQLGDVLHQHDIVEAIHMGTFNCRVIAGTSTLSEHSFGRAIDFFGFTDSHGRQYVVREDWEVGATDPQTEAGQVLFDIAQAMYDRSIFNIVLTPNYNDAHADHFHVDLTPGAHFLGARELGSSHLTDDEWWRCPAP